jgi:hypothetical protein
MAASDAPTIVRSRRKADSSEPVTTPHFLDWEANDVRLVSDTVPSQRRRCRSSAVRQTAHSYS